MPEEMLLRDLSVFRGSRLHAPQTRASRRQLIEGAFPEIGEWIYDQTGIEITVDKQVFDIYQNPRGQISCQGKISYKGPVSSTHALPRIKLDLTADERVVLPPVRVQIFHPYSDAPEDGIEVLAYDYIEAFAEKFRALAERTRPRDLYDVVHLYRNTEARPEPQRFIEVLRAKCEFKGISIPRLADLEPHRADLEAGWIHMLEHQLPALLPFKTFWDALPEIFNWLRGAVAQPLAAMPIGAGNTLIRERLVDLPAGSRGQSLIEMIRFAATNRLLVEIDYRDKQGNRSTRAIEAYSLRRSQAGDVLLMAVRADSGHSRSYLVDSILGVKATPNVIHAAVPNRTNAIGSPKHSEDSQVQLGSAFGAGRTPTVRRSPARRSTRSTGFGAESGPTYIFKCTVCGKTFNKKSYDATLNKHKNKRIGYKCYGTIGTFVRTKY